MAAIMIVLTSWLLYRYVAPKSWREWTGAGLIQAFIIALYAEMYGFPLTIYLLVRFFGMDRPDLNANLWSTLLGAGESGMMIAMFAGYFFLLAGFGMFFHGWRELYRAHKEKRMATTGLYALVRHPQYTGLFIALFGEGIVHWPTVFSVGLFPLIVAAYAYLASKEEQKVIEEFGEQYLVYKSTVPMFVPSFRAWKRVYQQLNQPQDERSM